MVGILSCGTKVPSTVRGVSESSLDQALIRLSTCNAMVAAAQFVGAGGCSIPPRCMPLLDSSMKVTHMGCGTEHGPITIDDK